MSLTISTAAATIGAETFPVTRACRARQSSDFSSCTITTPFAREFAASGISNACPRGFVVMGAT